LRARLAAAYTKCGRGRRLAEAGAQSAGVTGDPARFAEAHSQLLADRSIQFEMKPFEPPVVPDWLRWLLQLLEGSGPVFKVMFWIAVAAAVLFLLYWLARWVEGGGLAFLKRRRAAPVDETADGWRPEEAPARALLSEADALAAEGRYDEAAHLLLHRSIDDIDLRLPQLVRPALTSRDLAAVPTLPAGPRNAFSAIVMMVERSLFAGRALAEPDWKRCRAAYEAFAFAPEWKG
jgi:hypothetical protein